MARCSPSRPPKPELARSPDGLDWPRSTAARRRGLRRRRGGRRAGGAAGASGRTHAAAGQPRVPLEPDGTDARRVPRGRRGPRRSTRRRIPIVSNVTAQLAGDEFADPEYWVRHVREAVRFADGIAALRRARRHPFLELGPGSTLAALARIAHATRRSRRAARARAARPRRSRSCADAHIAGARPRLARLLRRPRQRVDLPTYAFQRERYWLTPRRHGDSRAPGLTRSSTRCSPPRCRSRGEDEWLFTGRLSLAAHPWLADHTVFDTVLVPGTALVELALAAGERIGCPTVDELTLEAPLVLAGEGDVEVQVIVGEPRRRRPPARRSRSTPGATARRDWVAPRARALLAPDSDARDAAGAGREAWPPEGAEPLDVDGLYDRLAELGFGYGPAFQGVTAAWRRGDELFAEVGARRAPGRRRRSASASTRRCSTPRFHVAAASTQLEPAGAAAVRLRGRAPAPPGARRCGCRSSPSGRGDAHAAAVDADGTPGAVRGRARDRGRSTPRSCVRPQADATPLLTRVELDRDRCRSAGDARGSPRSASVLGVARRHADLAALMPRSTRLPTRCSVAVPQRPASPTRSDDALGARAGADWRSRSTPPRPADRRHGRRRPGRPPPRCGLVRSAQAEHPGRFLPARRRRATPSRGRRCWPPTSRSSRCATARLLRPAPGQPSTEPPDPVSFGDGTVLVTGGTGGLGALVARHLVREHGVRDLLLVSRRGPQRPGRRRAARRRLAALGARRASRPATSPTAPRSTALLAGTRAPSLTARRPHRRRARRRDDRVAHRRAAATGCCGPRSTRARHLHELTPASTCAFVLFSSAGAAARRRRARATTPPPTPSSTRSRSSAAPHGLPATSLAWGLWDAGQRHGRRRSTTAAIAAAGRASASRALERRAGPRRSSTRARGRRRRCSSRASSTRARCCAPARSGAAPAAAARPRARARPPRPRRGAARWPSGWRALPEAEWDAAVLLDLVREHVAAAVLGHERADGDRPRPRRSRTWASTR